ncbi:hypothetical protein EDD18DRAFT_1361748 [Armillaria luteobubalina]|uniref:Uncharacterized protein n=1 Tax=Armillaria luteobubalina TaxID=153913 RepID=A0AA39PH83_9AGAR|nr:hypothetical protein EDD18DRAFT_1361748 [Armillaria luteobubalina]
MSYSLSRTGFAPEESWTQMRESDRLDEEILFSVLSPPRICDLFSDLGRWLRVACAPPSRIRSASTPDRVARACLGGRALPQAAWWSPEDLRALEWRLDTPTIGYVDDEHWGRFFGIGPLVFYLNKMGRPMGRHADLESERTWLQRVWTLQEMGGDYLIGGRAREGGAGCRGRNVPGCKLNCGISVVNDAEINKGTSLTDDECLKTAVLGWNIELLRTFFLIWDNMTNSSIMHRGQLY